MAKYMGLLMISAGAITLIASFIAGWTDSNAVLFSGLFFIIAGIIWHIISMKKESKY